MHPVVSVSITGSIPLLVAYQSSNVSYTQYSVFLSLGRYLYWWTISPRGYHTPSSQCFYHWVDTSTGGLLVLEGIIHPVVSVSITGSIPLLVDYQSSSVSYTQQSVFLSLGRYLYWWTISPREYHTPSSQCFYHWVDTSTGGLLVLEGIIHPLVSVSITWSIPLLVDYQSSSVSYTQQSVFLSLGRYLYWWTISPRVYHTPSSQCFYHQVDTSTGGILVLECIIHPVVSVSITGSIPLLVVYQSSGVSYTQQSVFLSLGRYLYWWTISHRGYHTPSSQCFYHQVNTSTGEILVLECIIHPVVSVSITGSIPLLVVYQSSGVSYTQQSVFRSLGPYLYWWTISPRGYHTPSSQCFYHWVDTSTGGLLVIEGIIHPVVSVSITGSIPLLVDYQSSRVSYTQQSVFLSLGRYLYCWTISPRGYHTPSSQCFYHWVDNSTVGLLVLEGIIHPVVSVSITGSIPLLVDYQSSRVSYTQQSVFLSLSRYLYWWTISPRVYHTPSSQCFYHWVDTSTGGLLVLEGIIHQVVSVSITGSIPLLVDYQSSRVSYTQQSVFLSLGRYLYWWTISPRVYHTPSSQCFYHWVDTSTGGLLVLEGIIHPVVSVSITESIPLLVDYQSSSVSCTQQSVFLSLGRYLYWWTISPRVYHTPSSQCFYHWVDTSTGGLLVLECIIHPVVSVSITGSIPLLVDYLSSRVSYSKWSVFLSLGRYLYWWTISLRGYHTPGSQCFYHWVDTSTGGLLVLESIIHPVVSVSITGSIPLLEVYQSSRVSYTQQSVFLSLGRYLYWWPISPLMYHTPSIQCFSHWVDTSTGGLLVLEGIIHPVVSVSITGSIPLLVVYQSSRVSYTQQSVFLSLGRYLYWWTISPRVYHTPSSQCFYHWVDTSTGGLLVLECIIHQVVSVSITRSIPLLVEYQSSSVSYTQQSVFLSLGRYLYWWSISPRGYHTPSSQCFYHWVDTSTGGLLVIEGIIHQVVSVSITRSIPLLVEYQSSSVSYTQQSVFLSLGRYLYWWSISPRGYHAPSSQCFDHWVHTSTGGL